MGGADQSKRRVGRLTAMKQRDGEVRTGVLRCDRHRRPLRKWLYDWGLTEYRQQVLPAADTLRRQARPVDSCSACQGII